MSMTAREFRRLFARHGAAGPFAFVRYAWPGGYPIYLVMQDGGCLCAECVDSERGRIHQAALARSHSGWEPEGVAINYEDPDLFCDSCNARIASAYAEDQADES